MNQRFLIGAIIAVAMIGVFSLVLLAAPGAGTSKLTLAFTAKAGDEPFVFDEYRYGNPGGEGTFQLRDFRLYLSNLELSDGIRRHVIEDSYHLVTFNNLNQTFELVLEDLPLKRIQSLSFIIGLDEEANNSVETRGDLDPNSHMAWTPETGYKFILAEGTMQVGEAQLPLVYHVGFDENRRPFKLDLPSSLRLSANAVVSMDVDVMQLFEGPNTIDMQSKPNVKMDRIDAALLADNATGMFRLSPS